VVAEDFVRQMIQTFNQHDPKAWAAVYAADAVVVDPQYAEPLRGREAIEKDISDFFTTFPDMSMQESSVLATGDQFAVEVTGRGTHKGPLEGPSGTIEPTNKPVNFRGAMFVRTNPDGLITEERRYFDMAGIMGQLGLL
jgi:steroid delta-isomerase-like uncharacterized protein